MSSLNATVGSTVKWRIEGDPTVGETLDTGTLTRTTTYLDTASGATKANKKYSAEVTLNASANTTFNFASFTDAFGASTNMTKCRVFRVDVTDGAIRMDMTNTSAFLQSFLGNVTANYASNPMPFALASGDVWHRESKTSNGMNSTSATILFTNTSNSATATYTIVVLGE